MPHDEVKVEQCDRDAAREFIAAEWPSWDSDHETVSAALMVAFARHRLAASPAPAEDAVEAIAALDMQALASAIHDARWDQGRAASSWVPFEEEIGSGKVYSLRIANAVQLYLLSALAAMQPRGEQQAGRGR